MSVPAVADGCVICNGRGEVATGQACPVCGGTGMATAEQAASYRQLLVDAAVQAATDRFRQAGTTAAEGVLRGLAQAHEDARETTARAGEVLAALKDARQAAWVAQQAALRVMGAETLVTRAEAAASRVATRLTAPDPTDPPPGITLPAGMGGEIFYADSLLVRQLDVWGPANLPNLVSAAYPTPMTTAGDMIFENTVPTPARLPIGSAGQVLTVVSGLPAWANNPAGFANPMTTAGDLIFENATPAPARLAIGASAQVLTVVSGLPAWANAPSGFANPMTTAGDLITGGGGGVAQRLGVGSAGQVLGVVSGAPAWVTNPAGFANPMTTAGDLITATAGGAAVRLGAGAAGTVLTMSGGVPAWLAPSGALNPSGDTSGTMDTANINAAIAALPVFTLQASPLITTAAGRITLAPGNWYINSTVNVPPWVIIQGSGPGTFINSKVNNGDCFFQQNTFPTGGAAFLTVLQGNSGGFRDLTIDGTSATGAAAGLHIDSMPNGLTVRGVRIQNFATAGAVGLHLSNSISYMECYYIQADIYGCTTACLVEKLSGGSESFRYGELILGVRALVGQTGVVMQGAHVVAGRVWIRANFAASASAGPANWAMLYLTPTAVGTSYAQIFSSHVLLVGEVDLNPLAFNPSALIMGGTNNLFTNNHGAIVFQNSTQNSILNSAPFSFWGTIGQDSVLQSANNQPGQVFLNGINTSTTPTVVTPAFSSGSTITNNTNFTVTVYVSGTLTAATTINGTTVGDTSTKTFRIAPGDRIVVTGAGASWQWIAA